MPQAQTQPLWLSLLLRDLLIGAFTKQALLGQIQIPPEGSKQWLGDTALSGALHSLLDSRWVQSFTNFLGQFWDVSVTCTSVLHLQNQSPVYRGHKSYGTRAAAGCWHSVCGPGHLCSAWTLPHTLLNKHRCANRGMCTRLYVLLRKSSRILGEGEMQTPNAAL